MSRRRRHSEEFKQNAVRRMLTSGKTASELARELGIHPTQLFRWKQQMGHTATAMPKQELDEKAARRPQDWSPEEKLEAVMKSQGLKMHPYLRSLSVQRMAGVLSALIAGPTSDGPQGRDWYLNE